MNSLSRTKPNPFLPETELKQVGSQSHWPSLDIGNVHIGFPVVQAALSGYSDWAMRIIARRLGASYTLCEVMLDQFVTSVRDNHKNRRFLKVSEEEHPVAAQLMGAQPEDFGPAAIRLVEAGFDVIDINFGCPVKKVLGRCRGGYLLGQVDRACEIVARVRDALPAHIPVTVKMRRGIDDSQESRDKFFAIFDGVFAHGAAGVTIHGRTVKQRYVGPSKWDFLRELKQLAPQRTILGSGDLFTAQSCWDMIQYTGVDGVTVARGAIGNPWIFSQVRALALGKPLPDPPGLHEQREILREHFRLAVEIYGVASASKRMRKFGIKYSQLHPQSEQVRDAFIKVQDTAQWHAALDSWYHDDLPGCPISPVADHNGECGGS